MKTTIKLLFMCVAALSQIKLSAQQVDLKELELTTSPAYSLLGVQPTNIQRPSTPRDLAAGLQSATVNGVLEPNFALEVNPFNWNKKKITNKHSFVANDYFSDKAFPAIKKNFALSLATSTSDTVVFGDLKKGTGLGYGVRITLLPGTVNKITKGNLRTWAENEAKQIYAQLLIATLNRNNNKISYAEKDAAFKAAENNLKGNIHIPDEWKPSLQTALRIYHEQLMNLTDMTQLAGLLTYQEEKFATEKAAALDVINERKVPFAREGFILELAYSGVTVLQGNTWDSAVYAKSGVWITPSYRMDLGSAKDPNLIQSFDFMGILRYIWNQQMVDKASYLDFGLKAQFNRNDWNLALEGVARHISEKPADVRSNWTYSWISNFSYTIRENITLRLSFGSKFDGNSRTFTKANEMIAIGGINVGFLK
jgi:hypothetical protein